MKEETKEKITLLIVAAVFLIPTLGFVVDKDSKILGTVFCVELIVFAAFYLLRFGYIREFYMKAFSTETRFLSSKPTEVDEEQLRIHALKEATQPKKVKPPLSQPVGTDAERQGLIVTPCWSRDKVNADSRTGHIIFEVRNHTGKKVLIAGYRMFRVSPNGNKDYYYQRKIAEADNFTKWLSSPHFQIPLMDRDEHIYHWDDVDIVEYYGIEHTGTWGTEVHIAYIEEGNSNILTSSGITHIKYE